MLNGVRLSDLNTCVDAIINAKLHYNLETQANGTILETRGDILIIPHASLVVY